MEIARYLYCVSCGRWQPGKVVFTGWGGGCKTVDSDHWSVFGGAHSQSHSFPGDSRGQVFPENRKRRPIHASIMRPRIEIICKRRQRLWGGELDGAFDEGQLNLWSVFRIHIGLIGALEGGFYLRKKPLESVVSVYCYSGDAVDRRARTAVESGDELDRMWPN